MSVIGEAYVKVRPDVSGFRRQTEAGVVAGSEAAGAKAGAAAGQAYGKSFASYAAKATVGFFAATEVIRGIKESVKAAGEQQAATATLSTVIKNAGAANTLYGQSIDSLIEKQGLQLGFTDDELLPAFSVLVSATKNTGKAYKDLGLAEDVARARHKSVAVAALALSKAEQGNVAALTRINVVLPDSIKKLGAKARATAALAEVERRYGGSAEAFSKTGEGAAQKFDAALNKIKETIGVALIPEVEAAANSLSKFLQNDQNITRLQGDVKAFADVAAGAFKAFVVSVRVVSTVLKPAIGLVGGFENAAKIAFGAYAVSRVLKMAGAIRAFGAAQLVAAAETRAAAAAEVAALEAVAAANAAAGASAAAAAPRLLAFSNSMLLLEAGAVAAGFGLGTLIIKATGLEGPLGRLGAKLAEVTGFAKDLSKASQDAAKNLNDAAVQNKLVDAYAKAKTLPKFARNAQVEALVGKGYTFDDAKIIAQAAARRRGKGSTFGITPLTPGSDVAAKGAGKSTADLDYKIKLQQALFTKTTADELALYQDHLAYVNRRIALLQKDNKLTADEKKQLLKLETQAVGLQGSISSIQDQAASAAKAEAADAKQKADAAKAAAKAKSDAAKALYAQSLTDQEALLQLGLKKTQLTAKNLKDDIAATRKLRAFYISESKDQKLTAQERTQFESLAIDQTLSIRDLKAQAKKKAGTKSAAPAFVAGEFFKTAAAQFGTYGSNIAGRNGVLSGQDERATVALRAFRGQSAQNIAQAIARQQAQRDQAKLTEAQKQTALLRRIANGVAQYGIPAPVADSIKRARKRAKSVGGDA